MHDVPLPQYLHLLYFQFLQHIQTLMKENILSIKQALFRNNQNQSNHNALCLVVYRAGNGDVTILPPCFIFGHIILPTGYPKPFISGSFLVCWTEGRRPTHEDVIHLIQTVLDAPMDQSGRHQQELGVTFQPVHLGIGYRPRMAGGGAQ